MADITIPVANVRGTMTNVNAGNNVHTGSGNLTVYQGGPDEPAVKLAEWVSRLDFSSHQSQAFERYTKNTLLWVLNEPKFVAWLEKAGILWCPGKPGAGKSVFVSFVVNHLQKEAAITPRPVVCYAYCRYHTTLTTLQLLEAVFSQLLLRCFLPDVVLNRLLSARDRKERLTVDDILSMLKEISIQIPNIFIVLDALDECFNEKTRHQVLHHLQELTSIHILVTSRLLPSIESAMGDVPTLHISAQAQDIQTYLEAQARSNPRLGRIIPKDRRADVEAQVIEKADGMFLLAHLHTETLAEQLNTADLLRVAETLPKEASQTYEATLQRIRERNENERRLAFHTLSWVLHAPEPLSPTELRHALAIDLARIATEHDLTDEEIIVSSCAGLIVLNRGKARWEGAETLKINFLHYTVQEFLQNASTTTDFLSDVQITLRCMRVLFFPGIQTSQHDYPFFNYASEAWGTLVRQHESDEQVRQLALSQLRDPTTLGMIDTEGYLSPEYSTALHYIAHFGLIRIYQAFTSTIEDASFALINERERDEHGWTALHWAATEGHAALVKQLLVVPSIDVNSKESRFGQTSLSLAASRGHLEVVRELLLHPNIDVDPKDTNGQTPFSLAAGSGHLKIVQELLRCPGNDVSSEDTNGRTPLAYAAERGHMEIVRELLRCPSNVDSKDINDRTPLSWAAERGHFEIVQELLHHLGPEYMRPTFVCTVQDGHLNVVCELMCHPDIDNESKDCVGQDLLVWAAKGGEWEVVKELLRYPNLDVNSKDSDFGQTPLSWLAGHGHIEVVQELLHHPRIDVASKDSNGQTPLSWAAQQGQVEVVQELLRHPGINADSKDIRGRTPLSWAAENGYLEVVQELLRYPGINIDSKDSKYRTPLSWACGEGRMEVVRRLVQEPDITIDQQDHTYLTPLIWATLAKGRRHLPSRFCHVTDLLIQTGKFELPGKRRFSAASSSRNAAHSSSSLTAPHSSQSQAPSLQHLPRIASRLPILHRPVFVTHRQMLGAS